MTSPEHRPVPRIGVLALQGGVAEHVEMLSGLGASTSLVRQPRDLAGIDGIVLPGGESSVFDKLARTFSLAEPLRELITAGLPTLGTCAGLIYLSSHVTDAAPDQRTLGVLDVTVRRNAFGSQLDSFETMITVAGVAEPVPATFIRAPVITAVGPEVEVISALPDGRIVGVQQAGITAYSFHPEQTGDPRLHQRWLDSVSAAAPV